MQSRTADVSKYRGVNDQRGGTAIAAKERELVSHVVDLSVDVGAVELAYASCCEVVCEAGLVRQRQALHYFHRSNVNPVCRNRVVWEGRAQRRAGVVRLVVDCHPGARAVDVAI